MFAEVLCEPPAKFSILNVCGGSGYAPLAVSTAKEMEFSIKDFFSKCYQIHSFRRIWSHLLKNFTGKFHVLRIVVNNTNKILGIFFLPKDVCVQN